MGICSFWCWDWDWICIH
ncbi:hypothetical protein Gotur_023270 [Gossypium turneri]